MKSQLLVSVAGAASLLAAQAISTGAVQPVEPLLRPAAAPPAATGAPPAGPEQSAKAELARPGDLVTAQRGSIPIILSAPHGGSVRVPGSTDRTSGVAVRDVRTSEAAMLVAQRLTEKLGAKPYFVIAQFSRKDADANRAPGAEAYENDAARQQYEAFHGALRACVEECREQFGVAILIDLHGQVRVPEALVRGTRNGKTVTALMKRHGRDAIIGPDSIFGRLKAAGFAVVPEIERDEPEAGVGRETFFDGGYIVAQYGSQNERGVDAVQIEMGSQRTDDLLKLTRVLGDSIAAFYEKFVKPDVRPPAAP